MAEWGSEGSNDTGWMRMDATGADTTSAQMAMSNLMIDFAPGAEISNLTFEVRVNGSNGTWIQEPQLLLPDAPASILDWRGLGSLVNRTISSTVILTVGASLPTATPMLDGYCRAVLR